MARPTRATTPAVRPDGRLGRADRPPSLPPEPHRHASQPPDLARRSSGLQPSGYARPRKAVLSSIGPQGSSAKGVAMATEPVLDWATDYDIFDSGLRRRPRPGLGRAPRQVPGRPHRALGRLVAADPLRGRRRDRARRRSVLLAEITVSPSLAASGDNVKAPPISSDPPEHLWARPTDPSRVLAEDGREVRAVHARALPLADRRVHRHRARRTRPRTTLSRSRCA